MKEQKHISWKRVLNSSPIRYSVVGISTTMVNYLVYFLFSLSFDINAHAGLLQSTYLWIANGLAWIVSVTYSFFGNRNYVFRARLGKKRMIYQAISFYGFRFLSGVAETVLLNILVTSFGMLDLWAKLLGTLLATIINYFVGKYLTFRVKKEK